MELLQAFQGSHCGGALFRMSHGRKGIFTIDPIHPTPREYGK